LKADQVVDGRKVMPTGFSAVLCLARESYSVKATNILLQEVAKTAIEISATELGFLGAFCGCGGGAVIVDRPVACRGVNAS
jgi:hypothetical protein